MKKTLAVLNKLVEDDIIEKYAIGGGIASLFYMASAGSFHLDVLVQVRKENERLRIGPIHDYLKAKCYQVKHGFFVIEGVPVSFIYPNDDLLCEALDKSISKTFDNIEVKVLTPEYLIALGLHTKADYFSRILDDINSSTLDQKLLKSIFNRYHLYSKWDEEMKGPSHKWRRITERKLFGHKRPTWKFVKSKNDGFSESMYQRDQEHAEKQADQPVEEKMKDMISWQGFLIKINIAGNKKLSSKRNIEDLSDILPWRT